MAQHIWENDQSLVSERTQFFRRFSGPRGSWYLVVRLSWIHGHPTVPESESARRARFKAEVPVKYGRAGAPPLTRIHTRTLT
jgi:hypothetical protein